MKKIIRLTEDDLTRLVKRVIGESISDERRGKGNSIDLKKKNKLNIAYKNDLPDYLENIRDSAISYWEDTLDIFQYEKEKLDKSKQVLTTQRYVSKTFIDSLTPETYEKSDIILVEDEDKNLWIMDGHHRLIFDRLNGKDSEVYIIPFDDIEEIDNTWYSSDDEEE